MYKINFKLSLTTYTKVNRYATYLNLPIQTAIRFLLTEQLHYYEYNLEHFDLNYKKCKPKDTFGTIDAYGNEKHPKKYSMEVSEYIYKNVQRIKTEYNDKTNSVINNLLHMGIREKFDNYSFDIATEYKEINQKELKPNTKQYAIPLSYEFTLRLEDISEITGIKVNQLISLIIGNYLIEHFTDYDNNIYQTESGQSHYSVW